LKDEAQIALFKDPVRKRSKHFYLRYKNQSIYVVWNRSHCLFSDRYKTLKLHLLNFKPVGASRNQ